MAPARERQPLVADGPEEVVAKAKALAFVRHEEVAEPMDAYELAAPSDELFQRNLKAATDHLVGTHKFRLTADDIRRLVLAAP